MSLMLSPETEKLIEERLKRGGYPSADDMLRAALDVLHHVEEQQVDDREVADVRQSLAQMKRGEVIDWFDLSARLRDKYLRP